jgi:hypothetical protein
MVLRLKTRESRSLPGLPSIWNQRAFKPYLRSQNPLTFWAGPYGLATRVLGDAGWSSPVARQAHNLKVAGSNPAPATKNCYCYQLLRAHQFGGPFCCLARVAALWQRMTEGCWIELAVYGVATRRRYAAQSYEAALLIPT